MMPFQTVQALLKEESFKETIFGALCVHRDEH